MANDIEERIRHGNVTLSLDTSVIWMFGKEYTELCKRIEEVNEKRKPLTIQLVISTVAYMELVNHFRQKYEDRFNPLLVSDSLKRMGNVQIAEFTQRHAEGTAEFLATKYPTKAMWQEAKRKLCARWLKLKVAEYASKTDLRCSATIDWLLIGQAACEQWIVVTKEKNDEWELFSDKISLKEIITLLDDLLKN